MRSCLWGMFKESFLKYLPVASELVSLNVIPTEVEGSRASKACLKVCNANFPVPITGLFSWIGGVGAGENYVFLKVHGHAKLAHELSL